ncbi:MAG: organomercurial lyase [Acidimicrobiia bacterium]|nr:organomercurial lyase [Acidimicrobiia bacterium]
MGDTHPDVVKTAYRETMRHFLETGRAPHFTELGRLLGLGMSEAREVQRAAAEAGIGSWMLEGTDFVECWAPFSNIPTHHRVSLDGVPMGFGQCGLEALAVTWIVPDAEVTIETSCLDCGEDVTVVQRDGEVLSVDPPGAVGHMNQPFANEDWFRGRGSFL